MAREGCDVPDDPQGGAMVTETADGKGMTTCPTFETSGDDRITPLCERTMARCQGRRADNAPLPERAGCRDDRDDLPNQPGRWQQPDVDVLVVVTPEIGSSERVRLVRFARAVEEATGRDDDAPLQTTPMPTDPISSFFVRITAPAHQRRRAPTQPVVNDAEQPGMCAMR